MTLDIDEHLRMAGTMEMRALALEEELEALTAIGQYSKDFGARHLAYATHISGYLQAAMTMRTLASNETIVALQLEAKKA